MMQGDPITLPFPPSVNSLYTGRGVNMRRNGKYTGWIKEAGWRIAEGRGNGSIKPLGSGWYFTHIQWPFLDRADADNRTKALHDLLRRHQITPDDKWLFGSTQMRSRQCKPGLCRVWYWTVDPDHPFCISAPTETEIHGVPV